LTRAWNNSHWARIRTAGRTDCRNTVAATIYVHYVFDVWAHRWRRRHASGDMTIVRYADDIVLGFEHRRDAERFLAAWQERLAAFGLQLHPDKTRLIDFGRHAADHLKSLGENKPENVRLPRVYPHLRDPCGRPVGSSSSARRFGVKERRPHPRRIPKAVQLDDRLRCP
jgi:hypothetical protein